MAAGAVAEQVAVELEQAAGDLEKVASVARRIDGRVIGALGIGLSAGAVVGFYFGYKYSKSKLRAEILEEAEKEVEEVREYYRQKLVSADNLDKKSVETIVQEKGYVSEEESRPKIEYARLEDPTEPPEPQSIRSNIFTHPTNPGSNPVVRATRVAKEKDDDWDWETEYVVREDETEPYILHQDEYEANESGYAQVAYIYYMGDEILVDEEDPKSILTNQEGLIGSKALTKFGHGADDYNTVYVRNPNLDLDIAIHRVRGSWEEEVLGLDPHESG